MLSAGPIRRSVIATRTRVHTLGRDLSVHMYAVYGQKVRKGDSAVFDSRPPAPCLRSAGIHTHQHAHLRKLSKTLVGSPHAQCGAVVLATGDCW